MQCNRILVALLALSGIRSLTLEPAAALAKGGTLELEIFEQEPGGGRRTTPARVHLTGPSGKPLRAPGLPFFRDHFNCPGRVQLDLSPGEYRYTIERGPEYRRARGTLSIQSDETTKRSVHLVRSIHLARRGWWSGEMHVHRALEDVPLLLRSEDLHIAPVLTVWNQKNLWSRRPLPQITLLEAETDRLYHVLSCEDERGGGALLYFNLSRPLDFRGDGRESPSPVKHLRNSRKQPGAWVDIEKPFWWDAPTWAATGLIDSVGLANNHMCRSTMLANEAWGRPRDAERLPPPRGNGFFTQELYYRLLNCGLRIPPSAGSASGVLPNPVGYNRIYVHLDGPLSWGAWWEGVRQGRSFVTNGPLLLVEANGRLPGEVFRGEVGKPLEIALDVRVESNDPIESIEVVRAGQVVERITEDLGRGWHRPETLVFRESGWFLVRTIARVPNTFRFASTAPFYVEVGENRSKTVARDAEFFASWIENRLRSLEGQPESVLEPHRRALEFYRKISSSR